jgi:hypothetical protein
VSSVAAAQFSPGAGVSAICNAPSSIQAEIERRT